MASQMTQGANEIVIDYRDDKTLRNLMPGAFGPYGFDSHRANLLVRGMVMHPSLKEALAKRVEEELTDRAAARFAKSLDRFNPVLFKQSQKANPTPTPQSDNSGQSDGESWTDEKTEALVRLHAQRVPFKDIAAQIEGKQVKGCQEHFYRAVKVEKWKQMHTKLREEYDA